MLGTHSAQTESVFVCRKNFRSVFNENTDQFCMQKNFRSLFNENTDLIFCCCSLYIIYIYIYVFSSLLQISKFKEESNLKLRHVNQPLKKELSM